MTRTATLLALVTLLAPGASVEAQENGRPELSGPPAMVVEAWENGEGDLLPGPPAWVFEMRFGEQDGMPPWVAARHAAAIEFGLPGPPMEVIEAWENGEGESLPGPPDFVFDLVFRFLR